MRANTQAINALPEYSTVETPQGVYGKLSFSSTLHAHRIALEHARDTNSDIWHSGSIWEGLDKQKREDFDKTHIADYPLSLVKSESAKLPHKATRLSNPRAAVTGAVWNIPAVLANIPLSARTRQRAKLPPKAFKLGFFMSAGIDAETMGKLTARIARAIWDYTMAGGSASLTIAMCGNYRFVTSTGTKGLIVETKVNCSDIAGISLALSPAFFRTICGPLMTACSDARGDGIPCPQHSPLPADYLWLGGIMDRAIEAAEQIIKELSITA